MRSRASVTHKRRPASIQQPCTCHAAPPLRPHRVRYEFDILSGLADIILPIAKASVSVQGIMGIHLQKKLFGVSGRSTPAHQGRIHGSQGSWVFWDVDHQASTRRKSRFSPVAVIAILGPCITTTACYRLYGRPACRTARQCRGSQSRGKIVITSCFTPRNALYPVRLQIRARRGISNVRCGCERSVSCVGCASRSEGAEEGKSRGRQMPVRASSSPDSRESSFSTINHYRRWPRREGALMPTPQVPVAIVKRLCIRRAWRRLSDGFVAPQPKAGCTPTAGQRRRCEGAAATAASVRSSCQLPPCAAPTRLGRPLCPGRCRTPLESPDSIFWRSETSYLTTCALAALLAPLPLQRARES